MKKTRTRSRDHGRIERHELRRTESDSPAVIGLGVVTAVIFAPIGSLILWRNCDIKVEAHRG